MIKEVILMLWRSCGLPTEWIWPESPFLGIEHGSVFKPGVYIDWGEDLFEVVSHRPFHGSFHE